MNIRKTNDLTYDELYYNYITLNATQKETATAVNSTVDCVASALKKFNICKTPAQVHELRIRACKKQPPLTPEKKEEKEQKRKQTLLSRYGENYYSSWAKKVATTNINRYGVKNAMHNQEISTKQQNRAAEVQKSQHDTILSKKIDTVMSRYGVENVGQCVDHTLKMQTTSKKKYGAISYSSTAECKAKVSEAWHNKSQVELDRIIEKRIQTCLDRYGVEHTSQLPSIWKSRRSIYYYNKIMFDSSYELAYYIWALDNKLDIKRCYEAFPFVVEGKTHYYYPDFRVGDRLVEIKGDHFYNDDNELYNPYTNDPAVQLVYKEKGILMQQLNVDVYRDVTEQLEYVKTVYGVGFMQQFRCKVEGWDD